MLIQHLQYVARRKEVPIPKFSNLKCGGHFFLISHFFFLYFCFLYFYLPSPITGYVLLIENGLYSWPDSVFRDWILEGTIGAGVSFFFPLPVLCFCGLEGSSLQNGTRGLCPLLACTVQCWICVQTHFLLLLPACYVRDENQLITSHISLWKLNMLV